MTRCRKCGQEYEGKRCKPCAAVYQRKWARQHPDRSKQLRHENYEKHKSKALEQSLEWAKNHRERSREIKRTYKLKNKDKTNAIARAGYAKNAEKMRERQNSPEYKAKKKAWYEQHRNQVFERILKRYRETVDKKRFRARALVRYAILAGKLTVPNSCVECGTMTKLECHHSDYEQPLKVIFLCRECHKRIHRKYQKEKE